MSDRNSEQPSRSPLLERHSSLRGVISPNVVSACAVSTSTALQAGEDYTACSVQVDLTKGLAGPE
jgi:hypothetical protein